MLVADHHTTEQLQELARAIPQKRIWRRLQAVILAKQGWTATDIAEPWAAPSRSVKNWVAQYNRGGIEALHERPRQRAAAAAGPGALPPAQATARRPAPTRGRRLYPPRHDIRRILEQEFGVHDEPPGRLRPAPSARLQQPDAAAAARGRHPRGAGVLQGDRRRADRRHRRSSTRTGRCGSTSRTRRGSARRGRSPGSGPRRGSRPRAVRQNGREWLYVLMAVCVGTGAASALIMPELGHRGHQPVPGAVLGRVAGGGPCGVDLGRGGLSHRRGSGGAGQREPDPAAAVLAGVEPGGEPVALPACPITGPIGSTRATRAWRRRPIRSLLAVCQDAETLKSVCNADYVQQRA